MRFHADSNFPHFELEENFARLIALLPIALVVLFTIGLVIPSTREFVHPLVHADPLIREGRLVEVATFILTLIGAAVGAYLSIKKHEFLLERLFFILFSAGMFFT